MANINFEFDKGSTAYSDGSIEDELLSIVKNNDTFDEILKNETRWPIIYHLSNMRQNILEWYTCDPNADVLEVGAGCGAITSLLCKKCRNVTALELTKRRATINYERNKKYENLEVYVGDIFKTKFERKFDYITLIGVFEYAAFMSESKNPYKELLDLLKNMLKPGGHILIAIENRYGLKYFAGAAEDHTGGYFDGINGYSGDTKVRTFTKNEMENMLHSSGLDEFTFYYPLPDYKFTQMIFTDETINQLNTEISSLSMDSDRFQLFDDNEVMQQMARESVLDTFANSFFIDIGSSKSDLLLSKISTSRRSKFRIITLIKKDRNDEIICIKKPSTEAGGQHVKNMCLNYNNYEKINGYKLVPCKICNEDSAIFKFVKGESLKKKLKKCIIDKDMESFYRLMDAYHENIFKDANVFCDYCERFQKMFGYARFDNPLLCAPINNLDLTFDNLLLDGDEFVATDYEWIFDFGIPIDYIFWRALIFAPILFKNSELYSEVKAHYKITDEMEAVFKHWEEKFQNSYVNSSENLVIRKDSYRVDLKKIMSNIINNDYTSALYMDFGEGLNEIDKIITESHRCGQENEFTAKFSPGKQVVSLRFDPLEQAFCSCKIVEIQSNNRKVYIVPTNSFLRRDDIDFFFSLDPSYRISGDFSDLQWLKIHYVVEKIEQKDVELILNEQKSRISVTLSRLFSQKTVSNANLLTKLRSYVKIYK